MVRYLILGGITDQSLGVRESDVAWCGSVALIVGDDLHLAVLKHSHTRVRRSKVDSDCWSFRHCILEQNTYTSAKIRQ